MRIGPEMTTLSRLGDWSERHERAAVLGELGLFLHARLEPQGYSASPTNAYAFASTGGDGVTFSLVDTGSGLADGSPVVMTVPMALGDGMQPNWILGQDLREFLALGLDTGYFALEELAAAFSLSPWTDVRGRLDRLSSEYAPRLRISSSDG